MDALSGVCDSFPHLALLGRYSRAHRVGTCRYLDLGKDSKVEMYTKVCGY